jgi:hypothetical protein
MRVTITHHYSDMNVEWDQWTGNFHMFSKEGERLGGLRGWAWTQEEAEQLLRKELGYVPDKKTILPALLNVFPFP